MEKLQQALERAREKRDSATARKGPGGAARGSVSAKSAAWAALTPFEPDRRALERNRILSASAGRQATPFDIMRTKTLLTMRKNGWKRLAITSPMAGAGKTTIACNLALGISRQPDVTGILFELDLRRPSIAQQLEMDEDIGIAEMFTGNVSFAEQARRYGDNVAICAAHERAKDPTSVLLSTALHAALDDIERVYQPDVMIFDLPPLLISDDARAFLKDVDCGLMIVQAEATTVAQVDACEREMAEQTNVVGVILNQCRHPDDVHTYSSYGG